jgi:hypothetical protein
VCIAGVSQLEFDGVNYTFRKSDIMLLQVETGVCIFQPCSIDVKLFDVISGFEALNLEKK